MPLKLRILLVFFLQPIALGAWLPRIPEIQAKLDLDAAGLAIGLIGSPIGTLITLTFAGGLVHRIGARRAIAIFFPAFLMVMLLPLMAPAQPALFVALMLVGASMSVLELGLNMAADDAEKRFGHTLMNAAHGLWSFGLMTGTLIGTLAAYFGLPPIVAGLAIAVLTAPAALWLALGLPAPAHPEPATDEVEALRRGFPPHPLLVGICLYVLGSSLTEGAAADWAAIFMRDAHGAGPGLSGLGVTAFSLAVASTRLAGDRLKTRFGAARLARGLALVGVLAGLLVCLSPSPVLALVGFALLGIGASLAFPLGVTAATRAPGPNAATNVAMMSFTALSGFLIGPILIGSITQATDIRFGLAILLPMLGMSAVLAPLLARAKG